MTVHDLQNLLDMGLDALQANKDIVTDKFLADVDGLMPTVKCFLQQISTDSEPLIHGLELAVDIEKRLHGPLGGKLEELFTKLRHRPLVLLVIAKLFIRGEDPDGTDDGPQ